MQHMSRHLVTALIAGTSVTSAIDARAEPAYYDLGAISYLGTGLPQEVFKSPASITVIDGESLEERAPVSIANLLRNVPGLRFTDQGIERITIRGESSRRVAILVDGQKLTDHTTYGTPVLVDPTNIERIEVVRGSSSVVSGSRAFGGVINIITKTGADTPFEVSATTGYISATDGYRAALSASGTTRLGAGEFDYRLSFGTSDQDDRESARGGLVPSGTEDENRSLHLGYRQGNHYLGIKAQAYDLAAEVFTGNPAFQISLPNRDLRKGAIFYEGTNLAPWLTSLHFDAYVQTVDRVFNNNITIPPTPPGPPFPVNVISDSVDKQETSGLNIHAELRLSERSRTVIGLEYEDDALRADKTSTTTVVGPPTVTTSFDKASIETLSLFGQHEIDFSDSLTGVFGARWYDVEARLKASTTNGVPNPPSSNGDSLALGSVGLVWTPNDRLALRANASQGYIYPTLSQLFLTTTAGGVLLTGNPNLKPETATTLELGARHDGENGLIDATLFYTRADDFIATVITGPTGTYQNTDEATSWGIELYAERDLGLWGLTAYSSLTAMQRRLSYANGFKTRDSGTPAVSGTVGLRRFWQQGATSGTLDLFVDGETDAKFRDDTGAVTEAVGGYATLNLRATADLGGGLSVTGELMNITDRVYEPFGQIPGAGRSANIFLTKTF